MRVYIRISFPRIPGAMGERDANFGPRWRRRWWGSQSWWWWWWDELSLPRSCLSCLRVLVLFGGEAPFAVPNNAHSLGYRIIDWPATRGDHYRALLLRPVSDLRAYYLPSGLLKIFHFFQGGFHSTARGQFVWFYFGIGPSRGGI